MLLERHASSFVLTRSSIARMSVGTAIDVDAADGIFDEIELDAVDDDALEAAVERRVTTGELGHASEVVAAADEKRLVQSQLRESTRGNAHHL